MGPKILAQLSMQKAAMDQTFGHGHTSAPKAKKKRKDSSSSEDSSEASDSSSSSGSSRKKAGKDRSPSDRSPDPKDVAEARARVKQVHA